MARYELLEDESRFEPVDKSPQDWSPREAMAQTVMGMLRGGIPALGMKAASETMHMLDRGIYELGGKATDKLVEKGVSPERAAQAGFAVNMLGQYAPNVLAGGAAERLARPTLEAAARRVMTSATHPPIDATLKGKTERGIETMLKEGINPTKGGVQKLDDLIAPLEAEVDKVIARADSMGKTVDRNAIAGAIRGVLPRFEGLPEKELEALARVESEFLAQQPARIPIADAQRFKENMGRWLREKSFGEIQAGEKEGMKALRRGLKEEIEREVPGVAGPNARMSELLNARSLAERRAAAGPNASPLGMAPLAHTPLTFWMSVLNTSDVGKAMLARALYSGAGGIPRSVGRTLGTAVTAPSASPDDSEFMQMHPWMGILSSPQPSDEFLRGILMSR